MNDTFFKVVIIGLPFGFSLMWFAYWVVKIYKEKQRLKKTRRAGAGAPAAAEELSSPADAPTAASSSDETPAKGGR